MVQVRSTTYVCDACGASAHEKKSIRKFAITAREREWNEVVGDLCAQCEATLLSFVDGMFGDSSELARPSANGKSS